MIITQSSAAIAQRNWDPIVKALDTGGYAVVKGLLTPEQCAAMTRLYDEAGVFRSRVVMARHGFGQGEYQYFSYPLPPIIQTIREAFYPPLAALANEWLERLGGSPTYPATLDRFLTRCWEAGQPRPTPLLLRYGPGDYNRLHQDLYGDLFFPIQLAILLNEPDRDFQGGEFVVTEARPRTQSRVTVVPLRQGDAIVFAVNLRPVHGTRGFYRAQHRHGVSVVRGGERHTLGVIFHDSR
jgi:hypothetical protein